MPFPNLPPLPPPPPQHHSAETLGRSVTSLALSAPQHNCRGGKRKKKKYKIEGLLQIWPWLWLGWGPAYNKSFISFTEGREWAAATGNEANVHMQNNQLSADFGAERYSLLLHFSHPVSTANHSQKCSGSTSPALNEQPVNFIHKITENVVCAGSFVFTKKKSLHMFPWWRIISCMQELFSALRMKKPNKHDN